MFPGLDPSKLDPQLIGEISDLMRTLPPAKLMQMQGLMQKAMGGADITAEMAAFERDLPADFRTRMARIMYRANGVPADFLAPGASAPVVESHSSAATTITNAREARLLILSAVRDGELTPEAAMTALFPGE